MPARPRSEDENEDAYDYEPSDSEDEYNQSEKELLKKVRNRKRKYSDSEDEVFNVGPSKDDDDDDEEEYDDDDDKSDLALSDIEGQANEDDLPDVRAWGKEKRKYYSTDYVDPDYGGFQGKDAHLAELEEEEARNLQKQLAQQLDDDDFKLEIFTEKSEEDNKAGEEKLEIGEVIKTDISKLSKRQKLQILRKESPEFFGLIEDFQAKMVVVKDYLSPILDKCKNEQTSDCKALDFVQTQYELIMNYCTNIYMYLVLKASKVNIQNHPIIKRLYQYRQLLSQLEPIFEEIIKPQIEIILKEMQSEEENVERKTEKKKTLKLLATLTREGSNNKKKGVPDDEEKRPSKKMKIYDDGDDEPEEDMQIDLDEDQSNSSEEEEEKEEAGTEDQDGEDVEKRAITYKMAKNKGLTPHRKKELRNPRVKHKLKYRKALIRRKGAVRDARKELSRYSGEISGIKSTVSKSIKIKS